MNASTRPAALATPTRTVNIAERLAEMAARFPDKAAVVIAGPEGTYASMTFRRLEEDVGRCAHGLFAAGLRRGARTVLMVRPGFDFFTLTFALFRLGAVPVLIDPGMGKRQLIGCLAEIEPEAFIGVPLAQFGRVLFRGSFRSVSTVVTVGRRWCWGGRTMKQVRAAATEPYPTAATEARELAAILFTSGSTGPAKGVEYTHGTFDAQVRYLHSVYGYSPDEVDLATFPLFALFDAALGMTAVIPDMDPRYPAKADPTKIIRAIQDCGVTHMFASPALLDRLSRYAVQQGAGLPSIRRVMTAGAPVQAAMLKRLRLVLPEHADVHTPYGATEALPIASIESREILGETAERTARGEGICVGRPLPGISVGIVPVGDKPIAEWSDDKCLPRGEIGEICVKGPVVTRAYHRNDEANALAKIAEGDEVWHRTGDVGHLDRDGRLWFCGRKAHIVTTPKGRLYTICCEAIFNQHPRVYRTAIVGVGPKKGQYPVLCVELEPGDNRRKLHELTEELRQLARTYDRTYPVHAVLYHPGFPVDVRHNAKIFREKLADWAEKRV